MKRNKCRLCRREGKKLFLKDTRCFSPKCPIERKGAVAPGPVRRARNKPSDFAIELREKQRAKRIYGIREIQFKNYYLKARRQGGSTG
ncbi:30S ribosomal protein S4, partial [Candidatus Shapirobacteria bacterium]|nr:30S ribosomal protein S4 [Candidatus Shapirobacteria bacterium]